MPSIWETSEGKTKFYCMKSIWLFTAVCTLCACESHRPIQVIEPNRSEAVHLLNDTVDRILTEASSVKLYCMKSMVNQDTVTVERDSLLGYPIETAFGTLKKKQRHIVDFLMNDVTLYDSIYPPIKQEFWPTFILEYKRRKQKAYCLVSLGTGEVAFANDMNQQKRYLMKNSRELRRWYAQMKAIINNKE